MWRFAVTFYNSCLRSFFGLTTRCIRLSRLLVRWTCLQVSVTMWESAVLQFALPATVFGPPSTFAGTCVHLFESQLFLSYQIQSKIRYKHSLLSRIASFCSSLICVFVRMGSGKLLTTPNLRVRLLKNRISQDLATSEDPCTDELSINNFSTDSCVCVSPNSSRARKCSFVFFKTLSNPRSHLISWFLGP